MNGMPAPPPVEYDSSTGTFRAVAWCSAPGTLAWVLVIALALFGFEDHMMWVVAGILAAAIVLVEWGLRRRRAARAAAAAAQSAAARSGDATRR